MKGGRGGGGETSLGGADAVGEANKPITGLKEGGGEGKKL